MKVPTNNVSENVPARSRACEGCREAKIRCRASQQPNTCQKCLDSKKECVIRTGPRTRRSKRVIAECPVSSSNSPANVKGVPASSTFSIDFALTAEPEFENTFEALRSMHEGHIDSILPATEEELDFTNDSDGFGRLPSPSLTPSSSTREYSITELDGKPQFSIASAESLLEHFHSMLPYLPCIVVPRNTTVRSLAATKPFLLLAILTCASTSKTLHGHSLYDAEFRKVLGLKFVSAGERSLELLQGLLIYCIWFPFHIRPQSQQILRYIRMAGDLVHDLGLSDDSTEHALLRSDDENLERLRAYLGYSYVDSIFASSWRPLFRNSDNNGPWILKCCNALEHLSTVMSDVTMVALARQGLLHFQAASTMYTSRQQTEEERRMLLLGIRARSHELVNRIPVGIPSGSSVKLTSLFIDLLVNAAGLLERHNQRKSSNKNEMLKPDPARIIDAVEPMRQFLDHIVELDSQAFAALTAVDWCRVILAVIMAIRLSLPMDEFPEFDSSWARSEIGLPSFLDRVCSKSHTMVLSSARIDTLSAVQVVLRVVKDKFQQRVQAAERREAATMRGVAHVTCPFLDGSLDQYLSQWDPDLSTTPLMAAPAAQGVLGTGTPGSIPATNNDQQPVFHDIWATMTMSWADTDA